jgi:hypothetical protein
MFEVSVGKGSLFVCTFDLMNYKDKYHEVRQMYNSVLEYVGSSGFAPAISIEEDYLGTVFA